MSEKCGINQTGIQTLRLTELKAYSKITDVNFMRNTLRILDASGKCGIDQSSIQILQLTKLKALHNIKKNYMEF